MAEALPARDGRRHDARHRLVLRRAEYASGAGNARIVSKTFDVKAVLMFRYNTHRKPGNAGADGLRSGCEDAGPAPPAARQAHHPLDARRRPLGVIAVTQKFSGQMVKRPAKGGEGPMLNPFSGRGRPALPGAVHSRLRRLRRPSSTRDLPRLV